jgi:5-(carboxyamino)imidazole ribonucleotide mutase
MKIVIIYGSANDQAFMQPGRDYLDKEKVAYEERVLSAHRNHAELAAYLQELNASKQRIVIVAVAGLSAALPGVVAVQTEYPVVGVPVPGGPLNGIDALLSICQVPGQVPLGTVGLHSKAGLNACMFAHRILKLGDVGK